MLPLLLLGCSPHPTPKLTDTNDPESHPIDTGTTDSDSGSIDSRETGETAHTGETADTVETGDSGETADTDTAEPPCDRSLPWTYVAAGWYSTCGIHSDGCAECWGIGEEEGGPEWDTGTYHYEGEDSPPGGEYVWIDLLTNSPYQGFGQHACGILSSGEAVCWGEDCCGETSPPTGEFVDLSWWSAGTFGVTAGGGIVAWGAATAPEGDDFVRIATGQYETYALAGDGALVALSYDGSREWEAPEGSFIDVDVEDYACGVETDGSLLCWDPDDPAGAEDFVLSLETPTGVFEQVCMADQTIACALDTSGAVACWGGGGDDFEAVPTGYEFTQIACGYFHICALTTDGQIVCWGLDAFGETVPPT